MKDIPVLQAATIPEDLLKADWEALLASQVALQGPHVRKRAARQSRELLPGNAPDSEHDVESGVDLRGFPISS